MAAELPSGVKKYSQSPVFAEASTPTKLTTDHDTKSGVWGKLVVSKGALEFIVPGPPSSKQRVEAGGFAVIEPTVPHRVCLIGPVEFQIEFYR